jgi:hypothetical protein
MGLRTQVPTHMRIHAHTCVRTVGCVSDMSTAVLIEAELRNLSWKFHACMPLATRPTACRSVLIDGGCALQLRPRRPCSARPAHSASATTTPTTARRASPGWPMSPHAKVRLPSREARTRTVAVVQSITCRRAAFGSKPAAASTSTPLQRAPRGRSPSPSAPVHPTCCDARPRLLLVYVVPTHGCLLDSRVSVRLPAVLPCTGIVTRLLARTCGVGPATAVPALNPPTAFALGIGANCPTGLFRITTVAGCASAAAVGARPYRGSLDSPYMPKGCYWLTIGGSFYYNTNAGFGTNLVAQPVCAGAPGLYGVLASKHPCVQRGRVYRALARSSGCKRGGETCLCRV